jgi:predicted transcriptional regulator
MGRPRKTESQKADTVSVTVRFPRELHERLSALAARDERTFHTTVMRAIRSGLGDAPPEAERDAPHGKRTR